MFNRYRLTLLVAAAVLAGHGCYDANLEGPGGFKCPCGEGWYCSGGVCYQGQAPNQDQGLVQNKDHGLLKNEQGVIKAPTCQVTGTEQTLPLAASGVQEGFDLAGRDSRSTLTASWSTKSSAGMGVHWATWISSTSGYQWGHEQTLEDKVEARGTAVGLYDKSVTQRSVLFYYVPGSKSVKVDSALWASLKTVDSRAGLGEHLSVVPLREKPGQFYVSFQEADRNVRVIQFDVEVSTKNTVNSWDITGPSLTCMSYGHGLSSRQNSKGQIELAFYSHGPSRIWVKTLTNPLNNTWQEQQPRTGTIPKLNVDVHGASEFSPGALVFTDHDGSDYRVSYWDGTTTFDLGKGIAPSMDGNTTHEAIVHRSGNDLYLRTRKKAGPAFGPWGYLTIKGLKATPTNEVIIRRSYTTPKQTDQRLWEVVYRGLSLSNNTHSLNHLTVTCTY